MEVEVAAVVQPPAEIPFVDAHSSSCSSSESSSGVGGPHTKVSSATAGATEEVSAAASTAAALVSTKMDNYASASPKLSNRFVWYVRSPGFLFVCGKRLLQGLLHDPGRKS